MSALDNPRHERFAQALAKGLSATDAYADAGYTGDRRNAARLATNDDIATRVQEITDRAAVRVELSKAWVLERLMRNARVCLGEEPAKVSFRVKRDEPPAQLEMTQHDPAGANRALELLGKELGMFVDRVQSETTVIDARDLGDDELLSIAGAGRNGAVAPAPRPH